MIQLRFASLSNLATALGVAALVAACGGSTSSSTDGGVSGSGGTGTGGTGTGGTGTGGTGTGGTGGTGTGGFGGTGTGGTGGTGTGGTAGIAGAGGSGGAPCVTDKDCPPQGLCGYPTSAMCAAKGECFPAPGAVCNSFSPGCACDGTVINVVCTGLPSGYTSKPLMHAGQCASKDAGASFACGQALSCASATEYCSVVEGGPCCNPPSYSCVAVPVACENDVTCKCIEAAIGAQQCTESGGGVTTTFLAP